MRRFDLIVFTTVVALAILIALTLWRGDRVGVRVVEIGPSARAEGVSTLSTISVRFDQPIELVDSAAVVQFDPHVDGDIRTERDVLEFDPRPGLAPSTAYTVTLLPSVRGRGNRQLLQPVTWQFTTASPQIIFTQADELGYQQLAKIPFKLNRAEELIPAQPIPLSDAPGGVYDFGVNPQTGDVVYSILAVTGTASLVMVGPEGTTNAQIDLCPDGACTNPAFSPDGELLAYVRRNASAFSAAIMSPPRLWLKHIASGEQADLFQEEQQLGFAPDWSADGEWLSYFAPGLTGVGIYNLDDGREAFYPTRTGDPATWHSTKLLLAMTEMADSGQGNEIRITAIDPLTGNRTDLSRSEYPVEDDPPAWSPAGDQMAFQRRELAGPRASLGSQIWVAKEDGSEARPLTTDPDVDHGPPAWAPGGRYLVYHTLPLKVADSGLSVWVADTESGRTWEVVRSGQRPQWLP